MWLFGPRLQGQQTIRGVRKMFHRIAASVFATVLLAPAGKVSSKGKSPDPRTMLTLPTASLCALRNAFASTVRSGFFCGKAADSKDQSSFFPADD
jgi:hypothetical protein